MMGEHLIDSIVGLTYDNEKIYFISSYIFAIQEYSCCCKKASILADFPEEVRREGAFERILKCRHKIYLFPCYAEDIYYFDLKEGTYHMLNIPQSIIEVMPKRKYFEVLEYKGDIYCVCRCPNVVVRINFETDNLQVYNMPLEMLRERTSMEGFYFSLEAVDNKLIYTFADDAIIEFLIDKNKFKITYLDGDNLKSPKDKCDIILGLCVDNNKNYWLYNYEGEIFKVIENRKIKVNIPKNYTCRYNDGYHDQPGIDRMFIANGSLYFTLRSKCKILQYNVNTEMVTWCDNNLAKWNDTGRQVAFSNYAKIDEDSFWIYNENDGALYKWSCIEGFTENVKIKLPIDMVLESQFADEQLLGSIIRKNDIKGYISYVKKVFREEKCEESINYGNKIYYELV